MATIRMTGGTSDDDLRSDSYVILRVFLKGNPSPIVFNPILSGPQDNNTQFDVSKDIGDVKSPTDISSFQIEQVSVQHGLETYDNWNMASVQFQFITQGSFPAVIAQSGFHRFKSDSATLDVPVQPPS
jgi:hypothetical protein